MKQIKKLLNELAKKNGWHGKDLDELNNEIKNLEEKNGR